VGLSFLLLLENILAPRNYVQGHLRFFRLRLILGDAGFVYFFTTIAFLYYSICVVMPKRHLHEHVHSQRIQPKAVEALAKICVTLIYIDCHGTTMFVHRGRFCHHHLEEEPLSSAIDENYKRTNLSLKNRLLFISAEIYEGRPPSLMIQTNAGLAKVYLFL
jgi:hypothetical protein